MQGTNKDASRLTGSVASDAGNHSPEQAGRKKSCKKLVRHAFHVINVTLFGSRGTSSVNCLSSGSSKVSIPRFARFREDSNLGSCINFQRKPRRTNSSQGARATPESFVTTSPNCAAEWHQRITVPYSTRLCLSASASKPDFLPFRPRQEDEERARASLTPRQSITKAAGICLASDYNTAHKHTHTHQTHNITRRQTDRDRERDRGRRQRKKEETTKEDKRQETQETQERQETREETRWRRERGWKRKEERRWEGKW